MGLGDRHSAHAVWGGQRRLNPKAGREAAVAYSALPPIMLLLIKKKLANNEASALSWTCHMPDLSPSYLPDKALTPCSE